MQLCHTLVNWHQLNVTEARTCHFVKYLLPQPCFPSWFFPSFFAYYIGTHKLRGDFKNPTEAFLEAHSGFRLGWNFPLICHQYVVEFV